MRRTNRIEQVCSPATLAGVEISGARCVAAVGCEATCQTEGQPIMREQNVCNARIVVRFSVCEPGQLGHGKRRNRHRPACVGPCFCSK